MTDEVIRALGLDGRVRAVAAATTETVETLRGLHDASPTVTAALGRLATGALLLAASLEKVTAREPILTLEVDGGGPAGRFLATASPSGWVRATVTEPRAQAPFRDDGKLDVAGVVGREGTLAVTRDPGTGEPYRGVVRLVSGELGKDIARYLDESEQTPAAVVLGVHVVPEGHVAHAGGYMLQLLPGVPDATAREITRRMLALGPVTGLLQQGESPEDWLRQLLPDDLEILERTPARFHCGCSMDRVERALKLLGQVEIESLLEDHPEGPVVLTCEFCRTVYPVPPGRLVELLEEVRGETPAEGDGRP